MRKKEMFLVMDIETANMVEDALAYDIGYAICDRSGNIEIKRSFVVADIFNHEKELMETAYYAKKLPLYYARIKSGETVVADLKLIRYIISQDMKRYGVKKVGAYNTYFDRTGMDRTLRYVTKSQYRWFFPYGTEFFCIWHMACQVIFTQKRFLNKAIEHDWFSPKGNIKTSAEIAYRYITKDEFFEEEHTGLSDVEIEVQIMAKCFAQHKKMKKNINRFCWRIPTKFHKENSGLV